MIDFYLYDNAIGTNIHLQNKINLQSIFLKKKIVFLVSIGHITNLLPFKKHRL